MLAGGRQEPSASRRSRVRHFQEWTQGWCSYCYKRQGGGDRRYFLLSMFAKQVSGSWKVRLLDRVLVTMLTNRIIRECDYRVRMDVSFRLIILTICEQLSHRTYVSIARETLLC